MNKNKDKDSFRRFLDGFLIFIWGGFFYSLTATKIPTLNESFLLGIIISLVSIYYIKKVRKENELPEFI
jgi:uncharacterized membrane protein YjjP (DUF1212 family)